MAPYPRKLRPRKASKASSPTPGTQARSSVLKSVKAALRSTRARIGGKRGRNGGEGAGDSEDGMEGAKDMEKGEEKKDGHVSEETMGVRPQPSSTIRRVKHSNNPLGFIEEEGDEDRDEEKEKEDEEEEKGQEQRDKEEDDKEEAHPTLSITIPPTPLTIHSFELAGTLGRGKFGHVHLARHITSNYICALKALPKASTDTLFRRELDVHQNLAHAHILRLLAWFHDTQTIYLVLEYAAGGCLFALLNAQPQRRFTERVAAGYVAQIASALRYMHTKNVAHRDLKPENVLLGLHGEAKLADFGYSVHSASGLRRTLVGTLEYLSPEVAGIMVRGGKGLYAAMAVDRWCLGVLVFELVVGRAPFAREGEEARERVKKIAGWDGRGLVFPGFVSGEAEGLIRELLNIDAENRMSLDDVLEHPWILKNTAPSA